MQLGMHEVDRPGGGSRRVHQMIPGIDFGEILSAFLDAFDSDDLEEMVRIRLDLKLRAVVPPGPDKRRIFKLLEWSEQRGLTDELIRAAYLERPNNPKIREIYQKFGLAVAVTVQHAGGGVPNAPTLATAPALEAMVKPRLKMVDLGIWGEKLAKIEGQVCRIDFNGNPNGSGFLVAPDLVLTNYHVLEGLILGKLDPASVTCRFDYKVLADGSRKEGEVVKIQHVLDFTRYSQAEADNDPDRQMPNLEELDHALIRLSHAIGSEPVGKNASAAAQPRGWVSLPKTQPPLSIGMPLLIAQHPDGSPIKLALDTESLLKVNDNGTRVRYATNTEHGSSGSPCFDIDWTLVALHHMGDPGWQNPRFNEGIPIGLIQARLNQKGLVVP